MWPGGWVGGGGGEMLVFWVGFGLCLGGGGGERGEVGGGGGVGEGGEETMENLSK